MAKISRIAKTDSETARQTRAFAPLLLDKHRSFMAFHREFLRLNM